MVPSPVFGGIIVVGTRCKMTRLGETNHVELFFRISLGRKTAHDVFRLPRHSSAIRNLAMVHQTAAFHIDEGQGNQSCLIDDISRRGGHDLAPLFWVTILVANFFAIWC